MDSLFAEGFSVGSDAQDAVSLDLTVSYETVTIDRPGGGNRRFSEDPDTGAFGVDSVAESDGDVGEVLVEERKVETTSYAKSDKPRGLALTHLGLTADYNEGLVSWFLNRANDLYFISLGFDLSGEKPLVLPPKAVQGVTYKVKRGEEVSISLGQGAPLYPPKTITGSLLAYVMVAESDAGARKVGETMAKVHEDLSKDGSVLDKVVALVKDPANVVVSQVLSAGAAALQPIATILKEQGDDHVGLFQGMFPASAPWTNLSDTQNGATITMQEVN